MKITIIMFNHVWIKCIICIEYIEGMNKMNIDGVIFDLDGTLWDSTDVVLKSWNRVVHDIRKVRVPITREELQGIMGLQLKEICVKFFPNLDERTSMEIMEACCIEENELIRCEGGVLYPNLVETLEKLCRKYPLYIVSNSHCGYIEAFLEYHKLENYFKDIECAGNTGLSKGYNIKKLIERNEIKQAVYVGDTKGDCEGARLADIPFIYAEYGFGKVDNYYKKIDNIIEILEIL